VKTGVECSVGAEWIDRIADDLMLDPKDCVGIGTSEVPVDPIDWHKIARRSGLDDGEAEVLWCMAMGFSRDRALKVLRRDGDAKGRRQLQAAWRRFDRKRCLEQVRAFLLAHRSEP